MQCGWRFCLDINLLLNSADVSWTAYILFMRVRHLAVRTLIQLKATHLLVVILNGVLPFNSASQIGMRLQQVGTHVESCPAC